MVLAALAAGALLLFAALAIDVGVVWSARTQGQNVADSSALAAAATMIDPAGPTVTLGPSRAAAKQYAAANSTVANPSVTVRDQDIVYGNWNLQTRTFHTPVNETDPNQVRAVEVTVLMDDVVNDNAPAFLSRLAGKQGYDVKNRAVAYLGFQGSFPEGFDWPIAIDSCDLVSDPSGCGDDFCATVANPPNPCALDEPQAGDGDVTCLEFSSTPEQNACWTQFDGQNPSINNADLQDIVDDGSPGDIESGDEVYLDNGDKTATQKHIKDKFEGTGDYAGNPSGVDRYPPFQAPPKSDSWVVKLPVVECQDETRCAGGDTHAITGGVCFEVREVSGPPARKIRGRFLCPTSSDPQERALYAEFCAPPPGEPVKPGGCNFGASATSVVLVD